MGIRDNFSQAQSEYESDLFCPEEETEDWEQSYDEYCDDLCKQQLEEGLEL